MGLRSDYPLSNICRRESSKFVAISSQSVRSKVFTRRTSYNLCRPIMSIRRRAFSPLQRHPLKGEHIEEYI